MIDFSGVRFTYDGASYALDGVSAHIAEGEFACILGGNGSGKSTLAKHVNALFAPDEGSVSVAGMDTLDPACTYLIRQTAGMVFQNPDDQLVASLVEDDVAFGPENLGVPTPELRERVTRCLAEVGLAGFECRETHALSGGQKQRVAIAGVLAMNPRILVLDEASAMLDPRGRDGLMRVCRGLHNQGFTIVMITHFMEEAAQADRVIVMDAGKVVCEGAPADVLTQTELLASLNLEVPFAARLSLDLRTAGVEISPAVDEDSLARELFELAGASAGGAANAASAGSAAGVASSEDAAQAASAASAADAPSALAASGPLPIDEFSGDAAARIELRDVSYAYDASAAKKQRKAATRQADWGAAPDEAWALRDVSLAVHQGEFLGVAGHTGSGKSTLIQHMNGILSPTKGTVTAFGMDIADKRNAAKVRGRIGVVFQYPERQLFAESVYKDVAFGPRNLGLSDAEVDASVREALSQVGLSFDDFAQRSPFELSGGQQRRVAFAGVLAMKPQVLVLDEPAAGLDPASRRAFLDMVSRLHDQGLTVVMVSHNMDDLAAMCNRVAVMDEGRLVGLAAPERLFTHAEALHAIGLGTTHAQGFANKLRAGGLALPAGYCAQADLVSRIAKAVRSNGL